MRPVDRGGSPRVYARYRDAGPDLHERLGDYCSYCERQIETHLAVEHVQPKSLVPALELEWTNFLLGCSNCNSTKGDTPINLQDYFWPDTENTLRAFQYSRGGLVRPHPDLDQFQCAKAQATLSLMGLDRDPGNPGRKPSSSDQRWLRRQQAWQLAEHYRCILAKQDAPAMREAITDIALGRGEFSIWWTVFAGDIDMRRRLREAFLGTHALSFDADENLLARQGGQL